VSLFSPARIECRVPSQAVALKRSIARAASLPARAMATVIAGIMTVTGASASRASFVAIELPGRRAARTSRPRGYSNRVERPRPPRLRQRPLSFPSFFPFDRRRLARARARATPRSSSVD